MCGRFSLFTPAPALAEAFDLAGPPEMAAGRLEQLGPRSDVYSLGATLECALTVRRPYTGPQAAEVQHSF